MIAYHHAVEFQHTLWDEALREARIIVDITCGNGHDLYYLATHAQAGANLYGIDIQEIAIKSSKERLEGYPVTFYKGSHDEVLEAHIPSGIDLLVANLGYLPKGDHQIMTHERTTIKAIQVAMAKLNPQGLITVVAYPGTEMGAKERDELVAFLKTIDQRKFHVSTWQPLNQQHNPPELYILQRRHL